MPISPEFIALMQQMSDRGLRIGQMFYNVFCEITSDGHDPFYTDNDKMAKRFSDYLDTYRLIQEKTNAPKDPT